MNQEFTFTLNSPITEKEMDLIEDVDFDNTNSIIFHTKNGKDVEFLKRKTGHWIPQDHNHTHGNVSTCIYFSPVCSECGHTGDFNMNFCPNCGADMRGEQDG